MADYAGAVAAMRTRMSGNWSETPVQYQNEQPPQDPWPPSPDAPWIYFEVIQTDSTIRGAGLPGNQTWLTMGHIFVHVFTPLNYGYPESLRLADAAGEIFRSQTLYNDNAGAKVVCYAPIVDGGDSASDDGNWFRVSVRVPFEFFFIK